MKIESIIKRAGGTKVQLGQETYHFLPDAEGRHVAEVDNPDHVGKLLGIPEGYRYVAETERLDRVDVAAGTDKATEEGEGAGTLQPQEEEAAAAEPEEEEQGEESEKPKLSEADQREQAAQAYQERFGSRPHGKWTTERILAELEAEADGEDE